MTLHEDKDAFRDAIRAASDYLGIRDVYVEKDYWVTYILERLSRSPNSKNVVFKGGTSLSKAYNLIERFSEDVDLAILKSVDQTETQVRNMIRSIEKEITSGFEEVNLDGITSKQKNFRKTAFNYERGISSDLKSGIQEKLILEINSFANPVPFETKAVNSMIAQFLIETENEKAIAKYTLEPFELNVLAPYSTLIEKILSLIRLSFYENVIERLKSKIRHFYDIYVLCECFPCKDYIASKEFKKDFVRMYAEDKTRFDDPDNWLKASYNESPIFASFDEIWSKVKGTYETDFKLLVHGNFPDAGQVSKQMIILIEFLR
ncbi:MAG TPA: nucleotidyl transferase AbiEii/AbiGii toxin family protein [Bacteroidales bacterium]|nr:nucleotidyl transferase AbiEii/AbiGii toxin family protein [Bacteroidales bacterium]